VCLLLFAVTALLGGEQDIAQLKWANFFAQSKKCGPGKNLGGEWEYLKDGKNEINLFLILT
jgi:hypothetical protein